MSLIEREAVVQRLRITDRRASGSLPRGPGLAGVSSAVASTVSFSCSCGSHPPSAAGPSTTTAWRKSSLASSPGSSWSTWPCPSPFSTECTQLPPSLRSIVRSSLRPHERPGRGVREQGRSPEPPGVARLGKYCLTGSRPVFCLPGLFPADWVAHHPG